MAVARIDDDGDRLVRLQQQGEHEIPAEYVAVANQTVAAQITDRASQGRDFAGGRVGVVVDETDTGNGDRLLPVAPDDDLFRYADPAECRREPRQQRLAADIEHAFRLVASQLVEFGATRRREYDRPPGVSSGRQVAALRLGEFVVADDAEHVVQPGDSALDVDQRLFGEDLASYLAHRRNRRPQRVIRPNDDRDPRLAKEYDGRRVVLGRDDEQRREPLPFGGEIEDL